MKNKNGLIFCTIGIFTAFVLLINSCFIVVETKQAIVLQFGEVVSKDTIGAGLHFKIPFIQNVMEFERRILNVNTEPKEIITLDQKRLIVDAYAKYYIKDPLKFYQSVGNEMGFVLRVAPILESNLREQIGKIPLLCLLSDCRQDVMSTVHASTYQQALNFGVEIIDVRISKTDLPEANSDAIFARMNADRDMLARQFRAQGQEDSNRIIASANKEEVSIVSDAERQAKIIMGDGDYEASLIYSKAYKVDESFFEFIRNMQMYSKILNPKNTKMILSGKEDLFRLFSSLKNNEHFNKK